jgi:hypothetical protein
MQTNNALNLKFKASSSKPTGGTSLTLQPGHLFIYLFIYLFTYLFIYVFIYYSLIHLFMKWIFCSSSKGKI